MPLSDTKLRHLVGKPYQGRPELTDRDGLGVRISKQGTITWQYRFRWDQKPARLTLGRYPDLCLKDARDLLPEIRNLLNQGIDPRQTRRPGSTHQQQADIRECVDQFLSVRVPNLKRKTQVQYASVMNRYFLNLFPDRPVNDIGLDEWLFWFDNIAASSPKVAANLLKVGKTLFNWCIRRRMIEQPALMSLRTEDVGMPADTGERVLSLNECGAIWRAVDQTRAIASTTICIKLCMLFGCRQGEIREAHRNHFDMQELLWTVPSQLSKTNKPIRRPITSETKRLICRAWSIYGEDDYLLPAEQNQSRPVTPAVINKLIRSIRSKLSDSKEVIEPWRCHDFRRTISTRLSEAGIMPHVTEKMLGHVLTGIMSAYNKHDWLEDQRKAYELWNHKILASVHGRQ
ncbi:MAG: tyrosine-type recombinase/integrase [Endozoicomonas sp.]